MLSFVGWLFVGKGKPIVDEDGIPVCTRHEKVRFGRGFAESTFRKHYTMHCEPFMCTFSSNLIARQGCS